MTETTGIREFAYIYKLPVDELSSHISSLPYTLLELIVETALNDDDFMFDLLTEMLNTLKANATLCNTKRALKKIFEVCKTLEAEGYFDFGDIEFLDNMETELENTIPPENKKPIKIIEDLINAGQLKKRPENNGKYKPFKSMPKFIQWCFDNGYGEDISVKFILENIYYRGDSPRSIQTYINRAKNGTINPQ